MIDRQENLPASSWDAAELPPHFVQFYDSSDFLLNTLAEFVRTTLRNGEAAIVVAMPEHITGLHHRLSNLGVDLSAATATKQYQALDAETMMSKFIVDGHADPDRFAAYFGGLITSTSKRYPEVRVFGEMVALSIAAGDRAGTIEIERLWNQLQQTHSFSLCCAYPLSSFANEDSEGLLDQICEQHDVVFPAESYSTLPTSEERSRTIAVLQQKARRLEAEIAQRRLAEEQLRIALEAERAAREEAETALKKRDEFVSVAAHELKTPLTSLMGHSQLMLRFLNNGRTIDPRQATTASDAMVKQTRKLTKLVTQLLEVSRFEAGRLPVENEVVGLSDLVRESVDAVTPSNERHMIRIDMPDSIRIVGDPLRLEQVLVNLLENAIKYSPNGGPIDITAYPSSSGEMIEVAVRDRGLGIPSAMRSQIFERFFQAHGDESRSGMGLGLYISRQIIEMHGGKVWAEHPPDGGTRFVFQLPLANTQHATTDTAAS